MAPKKRQNDIKKQKHLNSTPAFRSVLEQHLQRRIIGADSHLV